MAKIKSVYICSNCGYESAKWLGKCPGCGEWNTMNEEIKEAAKNPSTIKSKTAIYSPPQEITDIDTDDEKRYSTGSKELNRVLGGGLVKGSLVLIGGDPGIGKSTILMQVCNYMGQNGKKVLYVSGEESKRQIKLRASRLGVDGNNIFLYTQTDCQTICELIKEESPELVVIDSIQTMSLSDLSSSPGSVTQVRECTNMFMRCAKSLDVPIIVVGHVNKDGAIAGPKVLEHIVDTVLYFEGDKQMTYRILRAIKNRYGSTNEIGVLEMSDKGLFDVENPSLMLLSGRPKNVSGTCVACAIEGTRPILAEVQGLVCSSNYGNPRRMATGFDFNRMSLLLAVLEKRAGFFFSNTDAYLNIVGGLRLDEPAVDLAVAMALVSSLKDKPIDERTLAFGELGLAGEIRAVSHCGLRISEAQRLGFERCIVPYYSLKSINKSNYTDIEIIGVKNIREAFSFVSD
ncbi:MULTISPECIES: DNA repair protein RadA [unclassified Ruminococcus]|uniref:DNA repair protein RadA n=1 Tax=unclassified Ruminococcus TaxID=2608920 RepID=UPI00210A5438|nr:MULTISPECIES: DNA repair protein RadA [unclassified Ruminococcus]MCQ4022056.1 DNA repair protein RadA [Ruminococcus sp. zg-924]MCQ4114376.1 DNA repair protein RadA [Ruminococcus sp. zg-921]